MANIFISDELLALFVEGRTTVEESAAILTAAKENLDIRYYLETAIEDGMFFETKVAENAASKPVCQLYNLNIKHLPVMCLAANGVTNDCVVKCEAFVLSLFGKDSQYKRLYREACHHDWLRKNGTPLYNIGRLLELAQLSVSRRFGGTLDDVQDELNGNCSVIVALNANRLANPKSRSAVVCDHAVVVTDIDKAEGYLELYDPQSSNQRDRYAIETFLRAWKPSKNFFVSIIERGVRPYKPHPEYVAHIKLPTEIASIADMLAENAHDTWAQERLAETEKNKAKGNQEKTFDDSFMMPFSELPEKKRKSDYLSSLNTIKLLYKLGFTISSPKVSRQEYKPNSRTPEGAYVPKPINIDDVVLPKEIEELTEYIAENAHEEWAKDKIKKGWTFGPKRDNVLKQSFDLIPYCELLDSEKEYDRKMAMNTLKVLYKMGYMIEKFE